MTEAKKPVGFASRAAFRGWLAKNHAKQSELWLRLFKVHAGKRGVTYLEALEEALCFGWIDGVRHAFDADSFVQRFTPRKPVSKWSRVNLKRMKELEAAGLVAAAGRAALESAAKGPAGYSFESPPAELAASYLRQFRKNKTALAFFGQQAPWYRRTCSFWVMSAKQEETRLRRLGILIDCSAQQKTIPQLTKKRT